MNSTVEKIRSMMPLHPVIEIEIRRSGLSDEYIAAQLHMTPKGFRARIEGTAKCAIRFDDVLSLKSIVRSDYSLSTFMFNSQACMSDALCDYIVKALRSYSGDNITIPDMKDLNKNEQCEAMGFFTAVLKNVAVFTPQTLQALAEMEEKP